jgi:hypothetical protein
LILLYFNNNNWRKFTNQYKDATLHCRINGEITNIKVQRGVGFVKFKTGEGFSFFTAKNFNYKPSSFHNFISVGDSLFKNMNSDTVTVKRNQKEYFFILNKYIYK